MIETKTPFSDLIARLGIATTHLPADRELLREVRENALVCAEHSERAAYPSQRAAAKRLQQLLK